MGYNVQFQDSALKQLSKLDKQVQRRIIAYAEEIAAADDPSSIGVRLKGELGDFWKFRKGDYRLIADIQSGVMLVEIVKVGHRREVYR